jgi:hypothetical protein
MRANAPRFNSSWALVAANLLPLAGAVWLHWPIKEFMLLYWLECIVVALLTVVRWAICMVTTGNLMVVARLSALLFLGPLLVFALGTFCFVYGLFVVRIFFPTPSARAWGFVDRLFDPLVSALVDQPMLMLAVASIAFGHVYSFICDFLLTKEYRNITPGACVFWGVLQILPMHVGLIVLAATFVLSEGFAAFGSTAFVVGVFVLLKTLAQQVLHSKLTPLAADHATRRT